MNQLKNIIFLLGIIFSSSLSVAQTNGNIPEEAKRLSKALQINTISSYDSADFNPAAYLDFIGLLENSFPLLHQRLERTLINNYSLVYYWKGTNPTLLPVLFIAHYDVVPIEEQSLTKWEQAPFSGHIDDQYIWGRGANDDKFHLMALLETVEKLLATNFVPSQSIYLAFGHDEEIGGQEGAAKTADYFKDKKIQFEYIMDEGGAILQDVLPGLKKKMAFIATAEKGDMNIALSVQDIGGHSSAPAKETAIDILAKAIVKINKAPMPARLQSPTVQMLETIAPYLDGKTKFAIKNKWLFRKKILKELSKNYGTNALIRTIMTPTVISGGIKENSLPTFATVNINVRILQGDSVGSVVAHISKVINDDRIQLEVKAPYTNASSITPASGSVWKTLLETIKSIYPGIEIAPLVLPGKTDSRHYENLTKNIFRFIPLTITEENKGQVHGINEKIGIEEYQGAIKFYSLLIKNMGK